jgi:hypothetical protein
MSHTPGPWKIDKSQIASSGWAKILTPNADGLEPDLPVSIGKIYASENFKQDAELVAAAPDLLEALVYARANGGGFSPTGRRIIDAAIQKAQGEV